MKSSKPKKEKKVSTKPKPVKKKKVSTKPKIVKEKKVSTKPKKTKKSKTTPDKVKTIVEAETCLIEDTIHKDNKEFDNDTTVGILEEKPSDIVKSEDRITKNYMTIYEMVRILGERTKQLNMGAKPLIKNHKTLTYDQIAIEELKHNMIPYKIKRPINGKYEIWKISELRRDHLQSYLE